MDRYWNNLQGTAKAIFQAFGALTLIRTERDDVQAEDEAMVILEKLFTTDPNAKRPAHPVIVAMGVEERKIVGGGAYYYTIAFSINSRIERTIDQIREEERTEEIESKSDIEKMR
jgi:hypothetical protein